MAERCLLYCDGASRGNPGPAAVGAVLYSPTGDRLAEVSAAIGSATNNVAEYRSLIQGLRAARERGCAELTVYMDSQLVVYQISGRYKVKNSGLIPLHREAKECLRHFRSFRVEHIPRDKNKEADRLANAALDSN